MSFSTSDRLDLEVQRNQAEDKRFKVLNQVVEHSKTLRVGRLSDVDKGTDFRGLMASISTVSSMYG